MKNDTKTTYRYFKPGDLRGLELYLDDLSRQGWECRTPGRLRQVFRRGEGTFVHRFGYCAAPKGSADEITDTSDPDSPEIHMALSFRNQLLDGFLKEWQVRKQQLADGEITQEEYQEWKLNWPQTADGCGKHTPVRRWRKSE